MQSFTPFKTKEGQDIDNILSILEDANNNIWLGGNYCLRKFDGKVVTDMTQKRKLVKENVADKVQND